MSTQPGVTVYCLAFNHAAYIEKTLQGFLMQEVDFPFHVIIHDDASKDGTQDIIREYVSLRPDLFTAILQEENQYSKHLDIYKTFIVPRIHTEYVCICEGDDYWSDPQKLKLQYAYMQAHPECSMCTHNTQRITAEGISMNDPFSQLNEDRDYHADEVIASGGGVLFHTSSYMYRFRYREEMPECYRIKGVSDYPLAMHMSTCGHIHYIGRIMSHYRMNAPGSWTRRNVSSPEHHVQHLTKVIGLLEAVDAYTQGKYHAAFEAAIEKNNYDKYIAKNQILPVLRSNVYRKRFANEPAPRKLKLLVRGMAGPLLQPLKRMKNAIVAKSNKA